MYNKSSLIYQIKYRVGRIYTYEIKLRALDAILIGYQHYDSLGFLYTLLFQDTRK